MITFTDEQQAALDKIAMWRKGYSNSSEFLLDGGAGTGKTTVAAEAAYRMGKVNIQYAAFTAKAARVMAINGMNGAATLHSLLYHPTRNADGNLRWCHRGHNSSLAETDLLVVDECSMVNAEMLNDIRYYDVPTLVLGDTDGQLPPIKGTGAFYKQTPDARLLEPHRAALESEINRIAWLARRGAKLPRTHSDEVIVQSMMDPSSWDHITNGDNIVICGKHKTRLAVTRRCRAKYGFSGPLPCSGEPIICCRNNYDQDLVNGDTVVVWRITSNNPIEDYFEADIIVADGSTRPAVKIQRDLFEHTNANRPAPDDIPYSKGALFDWAYAITAHKAQGSEWDNVVVIDDQLMYWDRDFRRRWLYTALTRASARLIVLETTR